MTGADRVALEKRRMRRIEEDKINKPPVKKNPYRK